MKNYFGGGRGIKISGEVLNSVLILVLLLFKFSTHYPSITIFSSFPIEVQSRVSHKSQSGQWISDVYCIIWRDTRHRNEKLEEARWTNGAATLWLGYVDQKPNQPWVLKSQAQPAPWHKSISATLRISATLYQEKNIPVRFFFSFFCKEMKSHNCQHMCPNQIPVTCWRLSKEPAQRTELNRVSGEIAPSANSASIFALLFSLQMHFIHIQKLVSKHNSFRCI